MDLLAVEGICAIARALPHIAHPGRDEPLPPAVLQARGDALYGAWLCGSVLANVDMAIHHKLCHTLGGSFNLPHPETHTVMLPHTLAYNATAAPDAMQRIARALGGTNAPQRLFDLAKELGAPTALRELGFRVDQVDRACDLTLSNRYPNPRPLERAGIQKLLMDAFEGRRPD
ncbi:hypothetical protein GCM10023165_49300 [Variovorax defluvii]|uniref:Fe-containing alcohol dehydrogenase-like C-terminal domain-containing protein n=1 Tax=Variovorax defluvii TaxID=913761 RepID=A0ABP8ICX3_9BURK